MHENQIYFFMKILLVILFTSSSALYFIRARFWRVAIEMKYIDHEY